MGRIKKKLKKKVNPEKSNKMIIAVVVGLGILLAVAILVLNQYSPVPSTEKATREFLDYFKSKEGFLQVSQIRNNQFQVVYSSKIIDDYFSMAKFAGERMSLRLKNTDILLILSEGETSNITRRYTFRNGQVVKELKK
jgi:hypothetical protein